MIPMLSIVFSNVWERLASIVIAPLININIVWEAIIIIVLLTTQAFIRGKAKSKIKKFSEDSKNLKDQKDFTEDWSLNLTNAILIIYVAIQALRYVYGGEFTPSLMNFLTEPTRSGILGLVILQGYLLLFLHPTQFLPKRLGRFISSTIFVRIEAYLVMAVFYTYMPADLLTLAAAVVFFLIVYGFVLVLRRVAVSYYVKKQRENVVVED